MAFSFGPHTPSVTTPTTTPGLGYTDSVTGGKDVTAYTGPDDFDSYSMETTHQAETTPSVTSGGEDYSMASVESGSHQDNEVSTRAGGDNNRSDSADDREWSDSSGSQFGLSAGDFAPQSGVQLAFPANLSGLTSGGQTDVITTSIPLSFGGASKTISSTPAGITSANNFVEVPSDYTEEVPSQLRAFSERLLPSLAATATMNKVMGGLGSVVVEFFPDWAEIPVRATVGSLTSRGAWPFFKKPQDALEKDILGVDPVDPATEWYDEGDIAPGLVSATISSQTVKAVSAVLGPVEAATWSGYAKMLVASTALSSVAFIAADMAAKEAYKLISNIPGVNETRDAFKAGVVNFAKNVYADGPEAFLDLYNDLAGPTVNIPEGLAGELIEYELTGTVDGVDRYESYQEYAERYIGDGLSPPNLDAPTFEEFYEQQAVLTTEEVVQSLMDMFSNPSKSDTRTDHQPEVVMQGPASFGVSYAQDTLPVFSNIDESGRSSQTYTLSEPSQFDSVPDSGRSASLNHQSRADTHYTPTRVFTSSVETGEASSSPNISVQDDRFDTVTHQVHEDSNSDFVRPTLAHEPLMNYDELKAYMLIEGCDVFRFKDSQVPDRFEDSIDQIARLEKLGLIEVCTGNGAFDDKALTSVIDQMESGSLNDAGLFQQLFEQVDVFSFM